MTGVWPQTRSTRPERESAEGESADHIDHIDHASLKYEQKQVVGELANVIGTKSRPITSITFEKKSNENKYLERRVRYHCLPIQAK
jgi:hypothetical protein